MWLITLCALATLTAAALACIAYARGWYAHAAVATAGGSLCILLFALLVLARYNQGFQALLGAVPDIAWHISTALVSVAGIVGAYRVAGWLRGRR